MALEIVKILLKYSPANFTDDYNATRFVKDSRLIKSYIGSEPLRFETEVPYETTLNRGKTEKVLIQTKKVKIHEIEIMFSESFDFHLIQECQTIEITDNNNNTFDLKFVSEEPEKIDGTTLYKSVFTFSEILEDSLSVSSHVESDYILANKSEFNFLEIKNDIDVDTFDLITGKKFYTIFEPIIFWRELEEDGTLFKSATGQTFTISTDGCNVYKIKLFLNDTDLILLKKYIKSCFYYDNNNPRGIRLSSIIGSVYGEQTVNQDNIIINENDDLINLTEVDVEICTDFLRTSK